MGSRVGVLCAIPCRTSVRRVLKGSSVGAAHVGAVRVLSCCVRNGSKASRCDGPAGFVQTGQGSFVMLRRGVVGSGLHGQGLQRRGRQGMACPFLQRMGGHRTGSPAGELTVSPWNAVHRKPWERQLRWGKPRRVGFMSCLFRIGSLVTARCVEGVREKLRNAIHSFALAILQNKWPPGNVAIRLGLPCKLRGLQSLADKLRVA